jgi:hypothetical protein
MQKGFFGSLFDLSFSSLVTTKVIKVIYVISLIVIALVALLFVVGAFAESAALGVLTLLVLAPAIGLLYVVYTRVILEVIIAVFRLVEYNGELVALKRQQLGIAAPGAPPTASAGDTAQQPSTPPPPPPGDAPQEPGS